MPRDTTIHPLAILGNADMLERAGLAPGAFLTALGETRETLLGGKRVEWDTFAAALELASVRSYVDPSRMVEAAFASRRAAHVRVIEEIGHQGSMD